MNRIKPVLSYIAAFGPVVVLPALLATSTLSILYVIDLIIHTPQFEVGDCVEERREAVEKWETDRIELRAQILDLGKESYRIYDFDNRMSRSFSYWGQRHLEKIPCASVLKEELQ